MVFTLILHKTRNANMLSTISQLFFFEKKFIGVKFIASILEVRKGNEEICSVL